MSDDDDEQSICDRCEWETDDLTCCNLCAGCVCAECLDAEDPTVCQDCAERGEGSAG